jgi:hypothetical protein
MYRSSLQNTDCSQPDYLYSSSVESLTIVISNFRMRKPLPTPLLTPKVALKPQRMQVKFRSEPASVTFIISCAFCLRLVAANDSNSRNKWITDTSEMLPRSQPCLTWAPQVPERYWGYSKFPMRPSNITPDPSPCVNRYSGRTR